MEEKMSWSELGRKIKSGWLVYPFDERTVVAFKDVASVVMTLSQRTIVLLVLNKMLTVTNFSLIEVLAQWDVERGLGDQLRQFVEVPAWERISENLDRRLMWAPWESGDSFEGARVIPMRGAFKPYGKDVLRPDFLNIFGMM